MAAVKLEESSAMEGPGREHLRHRRRDRDGLDAAVALDGAL
jgi:hypothetical protein